MKHLRNSQMRQGTVKMVVLSLICLLVFATSTAKAKVPDNVLKHKRAVVTLLISGKDGKAVGTGSGFIISQDGMIVTNYHVISPLLEDKDNSLLVKMENGSFFPLEGVVSFDEENDLSIIKVMGKELPFLKLSLESNTKQGDDVFVIGSPQGLETTISDGIVSSIRGKKGFIQITAPISPGSSGSPVFNPKGEVIGVATFYFERGQNLNFAIPVKHLTSLLNSYKESKQKMAVPSPVKEPNLYKNSTYGISMTFPDGWVLKQEPVPNVIVWADGGENQEIILSVADLPKGSEKFDFKTMTDEIRKKYIERVLENLTKLGYEDVEVLEHGTTDIQNIKAIWGKGTYTKKQPFKEIKMKALEFYFAESGKLFKIGCHSPRERFGLIEKTCLQAIDTFVMKRELPKEKPFKESASLKKTSASGKKGPYAFSYDESKWTLTEPVPIPHADFHFKHVSGDAFAFSSFSINKMPTDNLTNIILNRMKSKLPDARVISEGKKILNGKEIIFMQVDATPKENGVLFSFYNYYYVGDKGTYHIGAWTAKSLFDDYKSDISELVDSLVISE